MLILIALIIVSIIILLLARIEIDISYKRMNVDDRLSIILKFFKIKLYEFEISMIDISKSEKGYGLNLIANKLKKKTSDEGHGFIHFETILNVYDDIKYYYRLYTSTFNDIKRSLARTSIIEKFDMKVEIGAFDHALTGVSSGLIYALMWNVFCLIANNIKTKKHEILVKPRFDINIFKLDLFCIFTMRIGNIIYVVIRLVLLYIRHKILKIKKNKKAEINLNIN